MMYVGDQGVYTYTFELQRKDDCPVCGGATVKVDVNKMETLEALIEQLVERKDLYVFVLFRCVGLICASYTHQTHL